MTAPTETPPAAPALQEGAPPCWTPQDYIDAGRLFAVDESKATALLARWSADEQKPLTASEEADGDLPAAYRQQTMDNRRLRLKETYRPDADALLQRARLVVALIEQQSVHHSTDVYLRRYSLRASAMQGRVDAASDAELPLLADEAVRQQSLELAGAIHASLARRTGLKPGALRAIGDTLARITIAERENAMGHAKAVRDRAIKLQVALFDRIVGEQASVYKLSAARKLEQPVW
jgi:hypothetical protein